MRNNASGPLKKTQKTMLLIFNKNPKTIFPLEKD
jgi:hypothetical protein